MVKSGIDPAIAILAGILTGAIFGALVGRLNSSFLIDFSVISITQKAIVYITFVTKV